MADFTGIRIQSARKGNYGLERRYDYQMLLNCCDDKFQEFNSLNLYLLCQTGFLHPVKESDTRLTCFKPPLIANILLLY